MKFQNLKSNYKNRLLFKQIEIKYSIILKVIKKYLSGKNLIKNFIYRIISLKKKMQITKIKNCCILSGTHNSVFKYLKLSRLQIKTLKNKGLLYGIQKSN